uniref:Tn3 resolvase n=1 Tax=Escherichia coli TaxID=562 RepID=A0A8E4T7J5_ECOLX|nr:Tn3 resolvase [Escherichia coli]
MGSCAAPSAKGDDKFITTDYLQQCRSLDRLRLRWRIVTTKIAATTVRRSVWLS